MFGDHHTCSPAFCRVALNENNGRSDCSEFFFAREVRVIVEQAKAIESATQQQPDIPEWYEQRRFVSLLQTLEGLQDEETVEITTAEITHSYFRADPLTHPTFGGEEHMRMMYEKHSCISGCQWSAWTFTNSIWSGHRSEGSAFGM